MSVLTQTQTPATLRPHSLLPPYLNMAKICDICGRGGLVGNTRSHSNIATKCKREVNLQTKHVDGSKFKVCTKCIKTVAKRQAMLKITV